VDVVTEAAAGGAGVQVVALGSQGRYYVAFEDGTMEFEGGGHSDFSEVVASEAVAVVAFGEHPTSYFTLLISGEFHWCVKEFGPNLIW
jgi:hypothetical protein